MNPETTYHAILGQILKTLRKDEGYDQATMADLMGVDRSSWSRIESGITTINIQQLHKAAQIFDKEANEILYEADLIARKLSKQGYKVHYEAINNAKAKKINKGLGLALIGGAALGLLVGSMLFSDKGPDKNNKS